MSAATEAHPARLTIDYPDRELDRVSTLLRPFYVLPIAIVVGLIGGTTSGGAFVGGMLVLPALLMILFRQKYPRWWFDSNSSSPASRPGCSPTQHTDRYPPFSLA